MELAPFGVLQTKKEIVMKNEVIYEWVIEQADEHGDIYDIDWRVTFAEAEEWRRLRLDEIESKREREFFNLDQLYLPEGSVEVASKRLVGNDLDGLQYWGYAYVDFENQTIDAEYCSGHRVPKHVTKQIEKWKKTSNQRLQGA